MKLFTIRRSQHFSLNIDETWEFFSSPLNLARITPSHMGFEIVSQLPKQMYAGTIIEYVVRPMAGIPISWVTEITQLKPPYLFIDEQRLGPYAFWHHQHHFSEVNNGTQVLDIVNYALPFGVLGSVAQNVYVRKQLEEIFNYRERMLDLLLNQQSIVKV